MSGKVVHTSKLTVTQVVQHLGRPTAVVFQAEKGDKIFDTDDGQPGRFQYSVGAKGSDIFKVGRRYDMSFTDVGEVKAEEPAPATETAPAPAPVQE